MAAWPASSVCLALALAWWSGDWSCPHRRGHSPQGRPWGALAGLVFPRGLVTDGWRAVYYGSLFPQKTFLSRCPDSKGAGKGNMPSPSGLISLQKAGPSGCVCLEAPAILHPSVVSPALTPVWDNLASCLPRPDLACTDYFSRSQLWCHFHLESCAALA